MPERSSKPKSKKKDINETAFLIMQQATGQVESMPSTPSEKNLAAVALGRLGGLKGGKARAASLNAEKRREIAAAAANKRWSKKAS